MNDAKNIYRTDLNEIFKSVQRQSFYAVKGLNNESFQPDDYAIFDTEDDYQVVKEFALEGAARIADDTHMIKYWTQTGIDALTNYEDLEDPENADSYADPNTEVDNDETITDPDGATIKVVNLSGEQHTAGEKLPYTDVDTSQDTIQFELNDFKDNSDEATRTEKRYTAIQQYIKNCLEHFILTKWWKLHNIQQLAAVNEKEYEDLTKRIRFNSITNHTYSDTKTPQKHFYGI